MKKTVALISGGSSGIGRATAQALAQSGYTVYELSRHDRPLPGVMHLQADLTDEASVQQAVDTLLRREGQLDLVINNAGAGISGAVEFTATRDAQALFDLNFFGVVRLNRAVIPHLRAQGSGRILHISSVAADAPIPFQAYYSASKAAVSSYALSLANELRPFGIEVCALQPGDIRTGFTAARQKLHQGDERYNGRIARSVARMEKDEQNGLPAEKAAAFIVRLVQKKRLPPLVTLGFSYQLVALLLRLLPTRLSQWLLYRLYAA